MTDLNNRLESALAKDGESFLHDLEDGRGPITQMLAAFTGPMALMAYIAMMFVIIFTGLMVWTAWEAFHAETDRATILWSAGFISSLIPHGLLRLWILNRANHLTVLRELKKTAIPQAFSALSPDHRAAAYLFFVEGLTLNEIAAAADVPLGTVKSRIFHAHRQLKARLPGDKND